MHPIGAPFLMENAGLSYLRNTANRGLVGDCLHNIFCLDKFFTTFTNAHMYHNLVDVDIAHCGHWSSPHPAFETVSFPIM